MVLISFELFLLSLLFVLIKWFVSSLVKRLFSSCITVQNAANDMVLPIKATSMKQPGIVFLERLSQLARGTREKPQQSPILMLVFHHEHLGRVKFPKDEENDFQGINSEQVNNRTTVFGSKYFPNKGVTCPGVILKFSLCYNFNLLAIATM